MPSTASANQEKTSTTQNLFIDKVFDCTIFYCFFITRTNYSLINRKNDGLSYTNKSSR